jgi:hypothetical protein
MGHNLYVVCENFCGGKISAETDHDPKCGADEVERRRLLKQLEEARGAGPVDEFEAGADDEDDEREIEVDGQPARLRRSRPAAAAEDQRSADAAALWRNPDLDSTWVAALQQRVNAEDLKIGGLPAGKACGGKQVVEIGGYPSEISCPNKVMLRTVRTNQCDLEHAHTETLEALCLVCAIASWGGGKSVAGPGPLFGEAS